MHFTSDTWESSPKTDYAQGNLVAQIFWEIQNLS